MLNWDPLGKGLHRDKDGKKSSQSALPGQRQPTHGTRNQTPHHGSQPVQGSSPKGLATLLPKATSGLTSAGLLSASTGLSSELQESRGLQLLAEAATMKPRSILKRGLPSNSGEPEPASKKVRFHEPSARLMVGGHPVHLSHKDYADLRASQRQLSRLFNVMEGTALVLNGTQAGNALAPIVNLYHGQIAPHQAQFNQRFRALMYSPSGEAEALPMKEMIDDWQWQKALTDLMERCLKATRQVKAIQENEFLEADVQDILEMVGAQKQSLEAIVASSSKD